VCSSNKDLIAIHQDPLAAPGQQLVKNGSITVWACALSGNRTAAVLLNMGGDPVDISVTWPALDALHHRYLAPAALAPHGCQSEQPRAGDLRQVMDVWQHKSVGTFADKFTANAVAPHAAVTIVVAAKLA